VLYGPCGTQARTQCGPATLSQALPNHGAALSRLQVFLTPTHLVLAMEYAQGGDLFQLVAARRGLPEDEARWFFQQLMIAVDYCHRMVRGPAGPGRRGQQPAALPCSKVHAAHAGAFTHRPRASLAPAVQASSVGAPTECSQPAPGSEQMAAGISAVCCAALCPHATLTLLHPSIRPCCCLQGVSSRDIKLENTLLNNSPRPLIKVGWEQAAS